MGRMLLLVLTISTTVKCSQTACVWATIDKCGASTEPLQVCQERSVETKEKLPDYVKTPRDGVEWSAVHYQHGHSFHIRNPRNEFQVCCKIRAHWELGKKWRASGFRKHPRFWKQCQTMYNQEKDQNQQLAGKSTFQRFMVFCVWERVVGTGATGTIELRKSLMALKLDNACPTIISTRDLPDDEAMVNAFIKLNHKSRG